MDNIVRMNTFPEIKVKATNFVHTPEMQAVLEKRLATLDKFLPADETNLICEVELERLSDQHSGRVYRAEVNLTVGGTFLRAEALEERMEDAIDHAKNELKRELTRTQEKRQSLLLRGARKIKDMMRFGR